MTDGNAVLCGDADSEGKEVGSIGSVFSKSLNLYIYLHFKKFRLALGYYFPALNIPSSFLNVVDYFFDNTAATITTTNCTTMIFNFPQLLSFISLFFMPIAATTKHENLSLS